MKTKKGRKPKSHKVDFALLEQLLLRLPQVPEGTKGEYAVTHEHIPAGQSLPVVSMRNAFLMNQVPASIKFQHDWVVRRLKHNDGVWMSDLPQEVYQMREPLAQAYGRVLIGGLGLGVVSHLMMQQQKVDWVTTCELQPDVIALVNPYISNRGVVICADLFEYVAEHIGTFDYAFFDIWAGTGETTWKDYVVQLRRLCRNKINQRDVTCWNEEEMKGQLRDALRRAAHVVHPTVNYYEPFRKYVQQRKIVRPVIDQESTVFREQLKTADGLQQWMELGVSNHRLQAAIEHYLAPGTDEWERDFAKAWAVDVVEYDARRRKEIDDETTSG